MNDEENGNDDSPFAQFGNDCGYYLIMSPITSEK